MELKDYINMGEVEAGTQVKLATILDIKDANIRRSKRGITPLPDPVCIVLANLIKVDPLKVIAASNLVTEKNPKRRKILEGCLATMTSIAFAILISVNSITSEAKSMLDNNNTMKNMVTFYLL